ncbi:MAG: hypothetical protein JXR31_05085 [Prolixibacteraceae bacterium]|nr:hypothetical protein [Prolixibacteraceae bacterium]
MDSQKITEIKGLIRFEKLRNDKRVVVFLVCLLISSALWFLNALNKDYETTLIYPVRYINLPEKRFLANDPPAEFELQVNAHGFALLRSKLNLSFAPIVLDVKRIIQDAEEINSMSYRISGSRLNSRISSQVSNEIDILGIRPESFLIVLDSLHAKQVSVIPQIDISFEPQYNITSAIKVLPEKVTFTAPGAVLDTLFTVFTEIKKYTKVKKPIEETLKLIVPDKIKVLPDNVKIIIPVEEFTEKKISIPVTVSDKPENVSIKLFPSRIQVSFTVGLSKYAEISENDFSFVIPFAEISKGKQNIQVQVEKQPQFIRELKYTPSTVEFLIEEE